MAEEVSLMHPRALSQTRVATPALDLPRALIADLTSVGISYEASSVCTFENHDYFSYRRDATTGRFAGVVWL
jgi:copper oxidase (laccase) domain-containing protein